jgi:hypothetical protein
MREAELRARSRGGDVYGKRQEQGRRGRVVVGCSLWCLVTGAGNRENVLVETNV